jgi:hypothetical protein
MFSCEECGKRLYESVKGDGFSFLKRLEEEVIDNTKTGYSYCFECGKCRMERWNIVDI